MSNLHKITDLKGRKRELDCIACSIQNGKVENPGKMAENEHFVAEQDYEIPIPGFVIIASKRHVYSIDELTQIEQETLIKFVFRLRKAMRELLDIKCVYLVHEEDTQNSHFHLWLFPRFKWMDDKFGTKVQSLKPIMDYARKNLKTEQNLHKVDDAIEKLRQFFTKST